MRLVVYNTEGKIFAKLSMHVETQSEGLFYAYVRIILREEYNSSSLTKHT